MDPVILSTATSVDWHGFADVLANSLMPDVLKISFQAVLLPLIGLSARFAANHLTSWYFKVIVKFAGQRIERGIEGWAESRMNLAVSTAQGTWWLRWMSQEDMQMYIEAAVSEWNLEYSASNQGKLP